MTLEGRATLVQGVSIYTNLIAEQYSPGATELEHLTLSGVHYVAVLVVFDHDWEQHLLVQQSTTGALARMLGMSEWEYALYLVSNGEVIHLHTFFDAPSAPLTEAAAMIECWRTHGHYGGVTNAVESDAFD